MERTQYVLGIDPDITRSGFAIIDQINRKIQLMSLTFQEALQWFEEHCNQTKEYTIIVEKSWQTAHNFHLNGKQNYVVASKIGYYIGMNHQAGKHIVEIAKYYGYDVVEKAPLRKVWKRGKITHDEMDLVLRHVDIIPPRRTNQEERDAAMLAMVGSRFPIDMKWRV